jgi:dTDP-4-amino-4,6-dideoxygalactose transaminase
MSDPFRVVRDFEAALCEYTGARYAVTTTSCTMALLLACAWEIKQAIDPRMNLGCAAFEIPKQTYVSVPQSIIHAGGRVSFRDEDWSGSYQLSPYPIWDCARRFTSAMYRPGQMQCVSFHWGKHLGLGQGGAILHADEDADPWLREARFDGRSEGVAPRDDEIGTVGWHCYMAPETAAQGLVRLALLPEHNDDLPNDDYPDLSKIEVFK